MLNRKDKELTSRTGYAGGLKTDGEGRVSISISLATSQFSVIHEIIPILSFFLPIFIAEPDEIAWLFGFRFATTIFNQSPIMENWDMVKLLA